MERPAKRRRLTQTASSYADSSTEASQSHRDCGQELNRFKGCGIQTTGSVAARRDINIITVNDSSNKNKNDIKQKLLDSLRFDQIDARQLSIKKAHARTCKWFLETEPYTKWIQKDTLHTDCNFLWIKGKPGAGKSTLMKFLLGELRNRIHKAKNDEILISFFFNARGSDLEKTTTGLYRSLLLQLLEARPNLRCVLDKIRLGHQWTIESLKTLFEEAVLELGDTPLVCLIDALDECEEKQIRDMVSYLSDLGLTGSRLYVCFASRHYPHITIKTGLSIVLEDQIGHSNDIATYLDSALHIRHNNVGEKIRRKLQEKASGVFMWVVLVVDIVNKDYDAGREHTLLRRIHELPDDLHDLFLDILTRDGHSTQGLLLCIQWVLFAHEPLTPKQLYFAVLSGLEPHNLVYCHSDDISEDTVKKYILDNSKGLAQSTNSYHPTIQFIHESVRDFFLKEDSLSRIWPDLSTNLSGQSHHALKQCCLEYMNMNVVAELKEDSHEMTTKRFSFLEYSNQWILYHAEQAQIHGVSQREFLATFPCSKWVQHHNILQKNNVSRYTPNVSRYTPNVSWYPPKVSRYTPNMNQYTPNVSLLYILAEAGMSALIRAYGNRQSCFEVEDERYGLPILAACATESSAAVQAMLERQAERLPDFSFADFCSQFPLGYDALSRSHRNFKFSKRGDLFRQLIKYGSDKVSLFFLSTELCDIGSKETNGKTFLMSAAENGFSLLVKALLEKNANPSAIDGYRDTPLHYASMHNTSMRSRVEVVKLLISRGANISAAGFYGKTPLDHAVENQNIELAELLIHHGANLLAANDNGNMLLHYASRCGSIELVNLLIHHGANPLATNDNGNTLLHSASRYGSIEVAKLLIHHGADPLAADNYFGNTPLHNASTNGSIEVTKLLIHHGADPLAADSYGNTPLHNASRYGSIEVTKLLIHHGADPLATNMNGDTPLHYANAHKHVEVANLLSSTIG
jgi:ankyrin repeat protein